MRLIRLFVILLALACVPKYSHATEVNLTSSTQYLWYQDFLANKSNDQGDVAEYVRLNVTKLDKDGNISIYGYGRGTQQVTNDVYAPGGGDAQGRLYYLYIDYRNVVKDHLDLRAGRTYVNATAVTGTLDGLYLNLKNVGPVGATAFGGREVIFQNKEEIGNGNLMNGASIYLDTQKNTHVELSYGNKFRDGRIARETFALDFSSIPQEMVKVYGTVKYDNISDELNELLFGVKLVPIKDLTLNVEYEQTRPTFDNNSIYRLFDVDRYQEISAAVEYQIIKNYKIKLKYAKEFFGEDTEANVYDIGLLANPIKDLTLNLSYEIRNGYTGQLSGFRVNAGYDINQATKIQAGIDYDDFTRDDSRAGIAKKYWGALSYQFNKMVGVTGRGEYDRNYESGDSYQGFVALNVKY
jgi:hypothetical protein